MRPYQKVAIFMIFYFIIIQVGISYGVPTKIIYNYRPNYNMILANSQNMEAVFEQVKKQIDEKKLNEYVVIIGDSVAYGPPEHAEKSVGVYLEKHFKEKGKEIPVFNLSVPSNQTGDIYTILRMMDQHGISREHVVINIIYSGFVARNPDPRPVFWFISDLKRIEEKEYYKIEENLKANQIDVDKKYSTLALLKEDAKDSIGVLKYKDYIQAYGKQFMDKTVPSNSNEAPWTEKSFLKDLLQKPEYQKGFSTEPFCMDETNYQIHFLNKIIELQKNKETLYFMVGFNTELVSEQTHDPNFIANMKAVDAYFQQKGVQYMNLSGKIENDLYSDHVHLVPEGYDKMANIVCDKIKGWF